MRITLKPLAAALVAAGGLAFALPAFAAGNMSGDAYKAEKDRIKAEYKADMKRCGSQSGNAKDICKAEAKGKEKAALADAEAAYKGTPKAQSDALVAHADAKYGVDKEKCDDLSGNAKDVCVKEAKAAYTKAKSDAKVKKANGEARSDANKETRDAQYNVAKERCDSLAGDAKDKCIADAKQRFGRS